jgi:hypothetical protein
VSRQIYLSLLIDHPGYCVRVGEGFDYDSLKRLSKFRSVRRRWWWPFYTQFGDTFFGETDGVSRTVYAPSPAHLHDQFPRRVSVVSAQDAVAMRNMMRPKDKAQTPAAPPASASSDYYLPSDTPVWRNDPDPWNRIAERAEKKGWQSGGGGDFGGGGATGNWDEPVKSTAFRMAADTGWDVKPMDSASDFKSLSDSVERYVADSPSSDSSSSSSYSSDSSSSTSSD